MSSVVATQLSLDISVGADLVPELGERAGAAEEIAASVERDLYPMLEELGLSGRPSISLRAADDARATTRLELAGHRSRIPRALRQAAQHLHGIDPSPEGWTDVAPLLSADILRDMCLEFLKLHADLLVGDEQVDLYARGLGSTVDLNAVRPERLRAVMKTVVSLGVSLRDVETVRSVLAQATEAPAEDLAEAVVTALGAPAVELRFAPDLLRELLGIRADGTPFSAMREALFSELGVELPSLHLVEDAALPARTFSVKVNALEHLAWRALPPGQIMTNCPVERLRDFEVEASPWLNPQGQAPFAIASADAAATIQALGLMTWEPLEHVALCCLETLRTRAPALLSWPMLDRRLDLLRVTNPRLMEVVDGLSGSSSLLRACRALVAEQLSIEDLVPILELWLEHAVRDDHAAVPHTLIASIREGLARQIAVRFGFGPRTSTLVVYLVAPQLESAVRDAVSRLGHTDLPCTDLGEQLADAARAELAFLSPALLPPAILTSADIRGAIRRVVSYEFPRLAVLSYNELPPTLNVQPVARIGAG